MERPRSFRLPPELDERDSRMTADTAPQPLWRKPVQLFAHLSTPSPDPRARSERLKRKCIFALSPLTLARAERTSDGQNGTHSKTPDPRARGSNLEFDSIRGAWKLIQASAKNSPTIKPDKPLRMSPTASNTPDGQTASRQTIKPALRLWEWMRQCCRTYEAGGGMAMPIP